MKFVSERSLLTHLFCEVCGCAKFVTDRNLVFNIHTSLYNSVFVVVAVTVCALLKFIPYTYHFYRCCTVPILFACGCETGFWCSHVAVLRAT